MSIGFFTFSILHFPTLLPVFFLFSVFLFVTSARIMKLLSEKAFSLFASYISLHNL